MCFIGKPYGGAGVIIWQFGLRDKGRARAAMDAERERERESEREESEDDSC